MPRIEPTIGSTQVPDDLPPELPVKQRTASKAAIRRSNQRKVATFTAVLYAIMVGVVVFLLRQQPKTSPNVLSYRLGETASYFLIAMVIALGFTFLSKKVWSWGFAAFLVLVFLVPVFLAGTQS